MPSLPRRWRACSDAPSIALVESSDGLRIEARVSTARPEPGRDALILSLIAVLAIAAVMFLGGEINAILSDVGQSI